MKLSIVITANPATSGAAKSAYDFCRAALASGHKVTGVFLLHDAMLLGLNDSLITRHWQLFSEKHSIEIHTCITAMERREINEDQLLPGFFAKGLAVLADNTLNSDRVVTFH